MGLYQVVTKKVSEHDTTETSLFYTSIIGIFFSLGIYLQIIALSMTRASIIQPFHYTLIFWAIILGYIFYDDFPDIPTLIGALVITISGIYTLYIKEQH